MDNLQPMGIGPLGSPTLIFVRKFRWTLTASQHLPEHFVRSVDFDFVKKQVRFRYMEIHIEDEDDIIIQRWAESDLKDEVMRFTTFNGCGSPLYEYVFFGLKIVEDKANFDYASSEESCREIVVSYDDYERRYFDKKGEMKIVKKRKWWQWTIQIEGHQELNVQPSERPTLHIEETELNHMNAKMWVPGKASWMPLDLALTHFEKQQLPALITSVAQKRSHFKAAFRLYRFDETKPDNRGELMETWELDDAWVQSTHNQGGYYHIVLRFSDVKYEGTQEHQDGRSKGKSKSGRKHTNTADQVCKGKKRVSNRK